MYRSLFLTAVLLLIAGCGGDNPLGRRAISGSVTLDGQPLAQGNIEFAPTDSGVSSGAPIRAGRYDIARLQGLPPGNYRVRIFASQVSTAPRTPEEALLPAAHRPGTEQIAARFNTASELTITVLDDGEDVFDFDVLSQ